jgi:hypothetical protein
MAMIEAMQRQFSDKLTVKNIVQKNTFFFQFPQSASFWIRIVTMLLNSSLEIFVFNIPSTAAL